MNLKVLVIEDKGIIGIHIKRTVIGMGHHVLMVVRNASDALKIAQKNKIDLVISDINLDGEMDGIECCTILQQNYNTPIIFLTAYHDLQTLQKASTLNFVGYLIKPFREDELETLINLAILKYNLPTEHERYIISTEYSYCFDNQKLFLYNTPVDLTKNEQKFLLLLIKFNGSLVSYDILEEHIWKGEIVDDGTRRQLIYRFKQKLENFPLELVKGKGYKLQKRSKKR